MKNYKIRPILFLLFIFCYSCDSGDTDQTKRILNIRDVESNPIENVRIRIDNDEYYSDEYGQAEVNINESIASMLFTIEKEGYQSVYLQVTPKFIGINDIYTLEEDNIFEKNVEQDNYEDNQESRLSTFEEDVPISTSFKSSLSDQTYTESEPEVASDIDDYEPQEEIIIDEVIDNVPTKFEEDEIIEEPVRDEVTEEVPEESFNADYSIEKFNEGDIFRENSNWNEAINSYREVGKEDLDLYTRAKIKSGIIKQKNLGDPKGALEDYKSALSTNNQKYFAEIHFNRAMCYHALLNWDESIKEFNSSFTFINSFSGSSNELKQKHHDLYYFWADALVRKANGEKDEKQKERYMKDAVLKIQDYLDKFEDYDSQKTKNMKSYLNNFTNKLDQTSEY